MIPYRTLPLIYSFIETTKQEGGVHHCWAWRGGFPPPGGVKFILTAKFKLPLKIKVGHEYSIYAASCVNLNALLCVRIELCDHDEEYAEKYSGDITHRIYLRKF